MKFIIWTDHKSLQHIPTQKHLSRRMVRWVECLQQFTFTIGCKSGKGNVVADALSRLHSLQLSMIETDHNVDWLLLISNYLQHQTFADDVPSEIKDLIERELHLFINDKSQETQYCRLNDDETAPYIPFISWLDLVLKMHGAYGHIGAAGIQLLMSRGR